MQLRRNPRAFQARRTSFSVRRFSNIRPRHVRTCSRPTLQAPPTLVVPERFANSGHGEVTLFHTRIDGLRFNRILIANDSRLLREAFQRALSSVLGMQVVGETVNLVDVLVLLERSDPHWLIVSLLPSGRIPDIIESLLKRHPALHILGVAPDGSRVQIKWQGHEETHDDLSFEDLVRILRARPLLN